MTDQQAALAIVGTVVASLVWVVKFLMTEFRQSIDGVKASLDRHVEAADGIKKATDSNTQVTQELQQFMYNLNGKLAKITSQKIKEQTVQHQTVQNRE